MSKFAIENVATNPANRGPLSLDGYPFGDLEVGQSFFVPNHQPSNRAQAVPFDLAKATFTDRKFRRVAATQSVTNEDGSTTTVAGFRYGRVA